MQKQLVTLFSRVHIPTTEGSANDPELVAALNAEIAVFGYTFDAAVLSALRALSEGAFHALRDELLDVLDDVTGAFGRHAPLFNRFPYDTPDHQSYLARRVIGHLQNLFEITPEDAKLLSCGHLVDLRLFDLKDFSACPICQHQVTELDAVDEVRHPFVSVTPLKLLSLADDRFLQRAVNALLARGCSLSAAEKGFLTDMIGKVAPDRPETVFRETLPIVYAYFAADDGLDYVRGLLSGATDVLRIATYLSDPDGDLALTRNVRFKLPTRHKKNMLRLLEGLDGLEEDLLRHRERWLRLGERLNPGSAANRALYPRTAAAFDALRNAPQVIETFSRAVDRKVRGKTVDRHLLDLLSRRPGEFMRRLDVLLRTAADTAPVLASLSSVVPDVPTKLLLEVGKYLRARAMQAEQPHRQRVFMPKGVANKVQITEDRRAPIPSVALEAAAAIISGELADRFARLPGMGAVFIDPELREMVMPFNRRGDSATNVAMTKGSHYPLNAKEVVRMFVHWTGAVDVDLSMSCYDAEFDFLEHIAWTNTKGNGCAHSGDVQSAPNGASEFIDFDIANLRQRKIRYVVMSIVSYTGQSFDQFPCFAGFMERDALLSGRKYEPQSVALKFDVSAETVSCLPLVFDLETSRVIYLDLAMGGHAYAEVTGMNQKLVGALRAGIGLVETKPTIWDVLQAHATARGSLVEDPAVADIVYMRETIDLEAVSALIA